ncbi:MAG TPA: DJ-1/PfpI family protein [Terriglobales bacterium]|nr:DJ-1/PfpI family protein [Terriglobales bacterium]
MKRREFVGGLTALGAITALSACSGGKAPEMVASAKPPENSAKSETVANPITPPATGRIPVAFVVSDGTVMIDLAGPWEVFNDVMISSRGKSMDDQMPFHTYTVAESLKPVRVSGGVKIVPEYTFANAPAPKIIVIPAQSGNKAMLEWIKKATKATDVTMSVCTGAYILASTGMLAGKPATTHHDAYKDFGMKFPDIELKRGARFVESGNLASSGGLSSGIDLALRVVQRYFGTKVATDTAYDMEYQGEGWKDPNSNAVYLKTVAVAPGHALCQICSMEVDMANAPKSEYKGKTYYFCSRDHKEKFDAAPDKWI